MISDLKPYPKYKSSAQAWVGDVPEHWSIVPNRAIFLEVKERNHPDAEMLSVTITRGIVRQKALLAGSSKKDSSNQDKSAYKLVKPRDIAYNKMRAWQGAFGASDFLGIISPAYVVMRLRDAENMPRYFHHLYRTPQFSKEAERWSYGITSDMWSLRPEHFKMIYTPEPPPGEQAAIVRFLDWANGRLERTILAKRRVIALLTEQKQGIIHHAVTRGLDPTVPLKPSGNPWIGDIPKHWEVRRLRFAVDDYGPGIQMGPFGSSLTELQSSDTGYKLFGQENTISGDFTRGVRWITKLQFKKLRKYELTPGDIVLTRKGSIGKARLVPLGIQRGIADSDTIRVRLNGRKVNSLFIVELLHSSTYVQRQLASTQRGAVLGGLNTATIGNIVLVLPPYQEQQALLEGLHLATKELDVIINRVEREIELLREYRTRLVADVVTGKLDVREAAARLPQDEVEPVLEADDLAEDEDGVDDELTEAEA